MGSAIRIFHGIPKPSQIKNTVAGLFGADGGGGADPQVAEDQSDEAVKAASDAERKRRRYLAGRKLTGRDDKDNGLGGIRDILG